MRNRIKGSLPGDRRLQVVETPHGALSRVICQDTDFPIVVRQAGQMDVDILLSPAAEWLAIVPQHAEMSAFRAVENGLSVCSRWLAWPAGRRARPVDRPRR